MNVPYTTRTGVQIGRLYTRPAPKTDRDGERIQSALLDQPARRDWDGIVIVVCVAALVALGVWL
jgi:hypothetical protein